MDDLDADAVPFPFGRVIAQVDHGFFQRMRQHERAEGRQIVDVGRRLALCCPVEQRGIGRLQAVPVFLHLVDRHGEGLREGRLGEAAGYADPHAAGG